jgi:hypothetical protein
MLARPERFELPTTWFEARYSIQLSYGRVFENNNLGFFVRGSCLIKRDLSNKLLYGLGGKYIGLRARQSYQRSQVTE